jgi:hypothetical protein
MSLLSSSLFPVMLAALLGGGAGCVEQTLTLDSTPSGALVTANDQELGRTPVTRDFVTYGNYELAFRLDGYDTLKVQQNVNCPVWMLIPSDLVCELLPFWFKDQRHYHYKLTAATTQEADPQRMQARAQDFKAMLESSPYTHPPTTRGTTLPAKKSGS